VTLFGVMVAGAFGALARYGTDRAVQLRWPRPFPLGTFVVNLIGCLALGVVVGLVDSSHLSDEWRDVLGAGLLGAFSTFSTFGYETVRLIERERWGTALANVALSVVVGVGAASVGLTLTSR
jgi:fluoride exporter